MISQCQKEKLKIASESREKKVLLRFILKWLLFEYIRKD